ncbi:MAG TPA: hypothetical protein VME47_25230, partial [Acetobacteraceae bacterium]|nr:hypothetical protein [Acetobacteraceae bacterium]
MHTDESGVTRSRESGPKHLYLPDDGARDTWPRRGRILARFCCFGAGDCPLDLLKDPFVKFGRRAPLPAAGGELLFALTVLLAFHADRVCGFAVHGIVADTQRCL